MNWFASHGCTNHAACRMCRNLKDGRPFRASINSARRLKGFPDWTCPHGIAWGAAPEPPEVCRHEYAEPAGKVIVRRHCRKGVPGRWRFQPMRCPDCDRTWDDRLGPASQ